MIASFPLASNILTGAQALRYETEVRSISNMIAIAIADGHKVAFCGNGGSAAQAQHLAAEFVGRFAREREPFPAISFTADIAILTAIANDYGYREVFSRQAAALLNAGDVLVLLSTSGASENCLAAIPEAHNAEAFTVGFTGKPGNLLAELCDYAITVDADNAATIQEVHLILGHAICGLVEEALA